MVCRRIGSTTKLVCDDVSSASNLALPIPSLILLAETDRSPRFARDDETDRNGIPADYEI